MGGAVWDCDVLRGVVIAGGLRASRGAHMPVRRG
jgi:hypothetical protein